MQDGTSKYRKKTQEDDGTGKLYTVTADFRKYACVEQSIADHSAYLLGAMNGKKRDMQDWLGRRITGKLSRLLRMAAMQRIVYMCRRFALLLRSMG